MNSYLNQKQDTETSSGLTAGKRARAPNQSAMNTLYVHKSIKYTQTNVAKQNEGQGTLPKQ